jgi:hypothetical protein
MSVLAVNHTFSRAPEVAAAVILYRGWLKAEGTLIKESAPGVFPICGYFTRSRPKFLRALAGEMFGYAEAVRVQ